MSRKVKARIAFGIAGVIAAFLILFALAMSYFHEKMEVSPSPESPTVQITDDGFPVVDWEYWQGVNPDVIGWVTVPGTVIDYPIVQAPSDDPDYYLHHDVYRDYNVYGVPYLDVDCADTGLFDSRNAVVFGHHMNDGSMFAAFADYSNLDFANEHARILVQTPEAKKVYLARCVDIVNGTELAKRTDFNDETDYREWYDSQLSGADVVIDAITQPQTAITFCTCSYNYSSNERTLVVASSDTAYLID